MSEMLMSSIYELPDFTSVIECEGDDTDSLTTSLEYAPKNIFKKDQQFPSVITHLLPEHVRLLEAGLDGLQDTTYWSQYLQEYAHPFDECPHAIFAILMMAHSYLGKTGKNSINSLIIHYQHDSYFKFGFSEIFMLLYPTIYALFLRFVGTEEGRL